MCLGQGFVQTSTFFHFPFIYFLLAKKGLGSFAATGANGINFEGQSGGVADRQMDMTFSRSHELSIDSMWDLYQTDDF